MQLQIPSPVQLITEQTGRFISDSRIPLYQSDCNSFVGLFRQCTPTGVHMT